jgi:hypothetical protein
MLSMKAFSHLKPEAVDTTDLKNARALLSEPQYLNLEGSEGLKEVSR